MNQAFLLRASRFKTGILYSAKTDWYSVFGRERSRELKILMEKPRDTASVENWTVGVFGQELTSWGGYPRECWAALGSVLGQRSDPIHTFEAFQLYSVFKEYLSMHSSIVWVQNGLKGLRADCNLRSMPTKILAETYMCLPSSCTLRCPRSGCWYVQ